MRVLSESWGPKNQSLTLNVSGITGKQYDLLLWNSEQVASVEGGKLIREKNGEPRVRIELPGTDYSSYVDGKVLIHFLSGSSGPKTKPRNR